MGYLPAFSVLAFAKCAALFVVGNVAVIAFLRIVASFFSVLPKETVGQLQWATERVVRRRKNRKSLKSMLNYREELYNKYIEFCPVCNKHTMVHYLLFREMRLNTLLAVQGNAVGDGVHYALSVQNDMTQGKVDHALTAARRPNRRGLQHILDLVRRVLREQLALPQVLAVQHLVHLANPQRALASQNGDAAAL